MDILENFLRLHKENLEKFGVDATLPYIPTDDGGQPLFTFKEVRKEYEKKFAPLPQRKDELFISFKLSLMAILCKYNSSVKVSKYFNASAQGVIWGYCKRHGYTRPQDIPISSKVQQIVYNIFLGRDYQTRDRQSVVEILDNEILNLNVRISELLNIKTKILSDDFNLKNITNDVINVINMCSTSTIQSLTNLLSQSNK